MRQLGPPAALVLILCCGAAAGAATLRFCMGCDFAGAQLSNADFSAANYVGTNFEGAELTWASFRGAKRADPSDAGTCSFVTADMLRRGSGSALSGATLP